MNPTRLSQRIRQPILALWIGIGFVAGASPAGIASKVAAKRQAARIILAFERDSDIWGLRSDGQVVRLLRNAKSPAWSHNGKRLAFYRNRALWTVPIDNLARAKRLCAMPEGAQTGAYDSLMTPTFTWHPKYPQIAFFVFHEYALRKNQKGAKPTIGQMGSIYSVPSNRPTKEENYQEWISPEMRGWESIGWLGATHPAWSPDGSKLAYARGGMLWIAEVSLKRDDWYQFGRLTIQSWDEDGIGDRVPSGGGIYVSNVLGCARIAWHPDGKRVAYHIRRWNGGSDNWIEMLDLNPSRRQKPVNMGLGRDPCFAPDGRLFYTDFHGSAIYVRDLKTNRERLVVKDAAFPACNPDPAAWHFATAMK